MSTNYNTNILYKSEVVPPYLGMCLEHERKVTNLHGKRILMYGLAYKPVPLIGMYCKLILSIQNNQPIIFLYF